MNLENKLIGIKDVNKKELRLNDRVDLFGMIGKVTKEKGAYGISFQEPINWKLINEKIPKIVEGNIPQFCYNDNFVSFWELFWNFDTEVWAYTYNRNEQITEIKNYLTCEYAKSPAIEEIEKVLGEPISSDIIRSLESNLERKLSAMSDNKIKELYEEFSETADHFNTTIDALKTLKNL